jgi:acetolactate synthase-1/2/3 large subunit
MDFRTDPTENVYPMVPGGRGLSEIILAEEL